VLYDAYLSKGAGERQVTLECDKALAPGDPFSYENETYSVVHVQPGHDEFEALIEAEWKGTWGPGQPAPLN
jgi:hypothetical protein